MKKLYAIKIEEVFVAENEEAALKLFRKMNRSNLLNEQFSVCEVCSVEDLPKGWNTNCIPYGEDDDDLTIEQYITEINCQKKIQTLIAAVNEELKIREGEPVFQIDVIFKQNVTSAVNYLQKLIGVQEVEDREKFDFAVLVLEQALSAVAEARQTGRLGFCIK